MQYSERKKVVAASDIFLFVLISVFPQDGLELA